MQNYISVSSDNEENSLTHHGVKGMKWGRRKDRRSSSSGRIRKNASDVKKAVSKKASDTKSKINNAISKIDKEKVKKIAKTSAVIAGRVAVVSLLGYAGATAMNEIHNLRTENFELGLKTGELQDKVATRNSQLVDLTKKSIDWSQKAEVGEALAKSLDGYDFKGFSKQDKAVIEDALEILKRK